MIVGKLIFMPQRDDKISRRFGKLPEHLWESLGENQGRRCEEALVTFFEARKRGEVFPPFPGHLPRGKRHTIWLEPEVSAELDEVADAAGTTFTSVLLAALRYSMGDEAIQPDPNTNIPPIRRPGPRRRSQ